MADNEMIPMRQMHADWMKKRQVAKTRREVDRQTINIIQKVVHDRVGRLKIAADNLDQQRVFLESSKFGGAHLGN